MNDFIETRSGVYIQRSAITRLETAADDSKFWLASTNEGKYYISKAKLPMTQRKVTK